MSYRICVLGASLENAHRMIDALCVENSEQVHKKQRGRLTLKDGTELIAMGINDRWRFDGQQFDEVFWDNTILELLEDWRTIRVLREVEPLLKSILARSIVPPEFQWWPLDW